jgi:predicted O-methyltransferase YrrM
MVSVAFRNLIFGGNLASLSLLRNPKLMHDYASENLFLFHAISGRRRLMLRNVYQVLNSANIESIALGNLHQKTWFSSPASYTADIVNLCLLCRALKPATIFEIGTFSGYTALHFALNTPESTRIFTLDLPSDDAIRPKLPTTTRDQSHVKYSKPMRQEMHYAFSDTDVAHKITCLSGDSAEFDFSPYHDKMDLFFIDGAHSYDYVRSDTLNALRCCHQGSVIAWHDYGRSGVNGVSKWLHELAQKYEIYSIPGGSLAFMVVP